MNIFSIFTKKKSVANRPRPRAFYIRVKARYEDDGRWFYRKLRPWEIDEYAATGEIHIRPTNHQHWGPCTKKVTSGRITLLHGNHVLDGFYTAPELNRAGFATLRQMSQRRRTRPRRQTA